MSDLNPLGHPQFDPAKFDRFTKGCEPVRSEIVHAFIEQTPLLVAELDAALREQTPNRTFRLIHKLKSSVSMFCTDDLYREISELERNTVHVESAEFVSRGRKLIMKVAKLMAEVKSYNFPDLKLI